MPLKLDYFYGNQAEQYSFYRIPKALFTDSRYKGVSVEAKVLYGLLLDRMSLSARNEWFDSSRRVYIYFTLEDALSQMGCGKDKAIKLFKELDVVSGIGLIERKKQGQGKPTRIYVKNFIIPETANPPALPEPSAAPDPPPEPEPPTTPEPSPMPDPSPAAEAQTSENQKSKPLNIMGIKALEEPNPEFPGAPEVKTSENPKSAIRQTRSQDCGIPDPNKTEKNNTEFNETDPSIYPPTPTLRASPPFEQRPNVQRRKRMLEEIETYREIIRENIDYPELLRQYPYEDDILDSCVELMVEVCCTRREFTRINRSDLPTEVVKSHFLKLTSDHISFALDRMNQNPAKVENVKAYMLTTLYNAPILMPQYYRSLASHDIAHGLV